MKLVIGGANQGKAEFVRRKFKAEPKICNDKTALTAECINSYHNLIADLLKANQDPQEFTQRLIAENPNAVIICDEIGLGIVPLDAFQRKWREEVGRCLCLIAEKSDYVCRILAGLETRIK